MCIDIQDMLRRVQQLLGCEHHRRLQRCWWHWRSYHKRAPLLQDHPRLGQGYSLRTMREQLLNWGGTISLPGTFFQEKPRQVAIARVTYKRRCMGERTCQTGLIMYIPQDWDGRPRYHQRPMLPLRVLEKRMQCKNECRVHEMDRITNLRPKRD